MRILRGLLCSLCALLLAAHFLRSEILLFVIGSLLLVPLAFVPRPWARVTVRTALILGALEWLRTLLVLRAVRMAEGTPYLRMTIILLVVAVLTAFSGWWVGRPQKVTEDAP